MIAEVFQERLGSPMCLLSHPSYFSSELGLADISYLHGLSSVALAMALGVGLRHLGHTSAESNGGA